MNARLADREFLAGRYSIADMLASAGCGWPNGKGRICDNFPHLNRWFETIRARGAVKRAFAIRVEAASTVNIRDPKVRAVLFGQRAR